MKTVNLIIVLLLTGAAGVGNVWADPGHVRFGAMIGPYWMWSPYYYPLYRPPEAVERPAPQAFIKRQPQQLAAAAPVTWAAAIARRRAIILAAMGARADGGKCCRGSMANVESKP